ncbi:Rap1a/Tai family immunity protein [Xanthomonas arboricola]|uniref:Rap1a/Tai family immunity protein n=1 Tax=Xanthomonas arboricola TaxID=56448 RepID=UPI000A90D27C|nr:Rap1a/Tai family immunity protein [Xanthomonas arboricola]
MNWKVVCGSWRLLAALLLCAEMPAAWAGSTDTGRDWIVSGAELMQAIEGKPGGSAREDEARRQLASTHASAYIEGVADATSGARWCGAGKILPHELVDRVYTYQRGLPAERLQQSAVTLVIEALAQALPCASRP